MDTQIVAPPLLDPAPSTSNRETVAARPVRRVNGRAALWLTPVVIVFALTVIGPWVTPFDPRRVVGPASLPPGSRYWFGTDASGLDVFSQLLAATRADSVIALTVAALATGAGIAVGLFLGMNESAEGWFGRASRTAARIIDFVQALPPILIGLMAISLSAPNKSL